MGAPSVLGMLRAVGFTITFPTSREAPDSAALTDWLRQRGEPFHEEDGLLRLRAIDLVLTLGKTIAAELEINAQVDLTRVVDLVFELSILVGADVRLHGAGDVTRGNFWLRLADEQDRLRIREALDRAELHGRREEVSQRLWQIVSAIRPGKDDRWDAHRGRIVELREVGAPDGISLADAGWHTDDPEVGDVVAVAIEGWVHSLVWRWLSEAYPGLAEFDHTFH